MNSIRVGNIYYSHNSRNYYLILKIVEKYEKYVKAECLILYGPEYSDNSEANIVFRNIPYDTPNGEIISKTLDEFYIG